MTLSCISNHIGGPLIGTTLWTGVPFRDVLAEAGPAPDARFVRIKSAGRLRRGDRPRPGRRAIPASSSAYDWDRQPLTRQHGFPLRVFIPDLYGMKQPKWITQHHADGRVEPRLLGGAELGPDGRGQDDLGHRHGGDQVAADARTDRPSCPSAASRTRGRRASPRSRSRSTTVPGSRRELRQPLSDLTWVLWRYDWPFSAGTHTLTVRAFDGQGRPQVTEQAPSAQGTAATGLFSEQRTIEPSP